MSEAERPEQARRDEEPRKGEDVRPDEEPRRDQEARLIAGRYRLGAVLGRGGMGTVWRATDETLGRTVAVKELRFPSSIDEDEKRRLITRTLREAKAIARIRDHGAVTVFDVVDEDDRPWIVMELIEGKSLAEVIREDGRLAPKRAAEVALAVLDVLRSAHREGILHRDVKPSNVLIADDGRVVLTDFGIAQVEGDPSITSTGMLVGAPSYISPERARGHKPGPAADLWSLGGLLYAAVEGTPPYDKGSAIATLTAVMTEPLEPPQHAGNLDKVLYGLLEKDPEKRLDDAGARALLLDVIHAPEPVAEKPLPPASEQTKVVPLPGEPEPAAKAPAAAVPAAAATAGGAAATGGTAATVNSAAADGGSAGGAAPARRASLGDLVPKRTQLIVAVLVALAVLGTALGFALSGGDEKGGGRDESSASAGTDGGSGKDSSQGGGGKTDEGKTDDGKGEKDGQGDKGKDSEGGSGSGSGEGDSGGQGTDGLPAGFRQVTNGQFKFSMAMPENFRRTGTAGQNSGAIFSADGGFPRIQVDFNSRPSDDAVAAWRSLLPAIRGASTNFKLLGIHQVDYKGYPTVADWEFERDQNGERVRVLNRGFKVDATHGYAIMISCKKSEWDGEECRTLRKTAFDTFQPRD
ncbi:serine/threonine-protein kinase [Streptomyces indicus]|uniref:non-specific serine/threonine protein kinase n=1 Tax=Streptomyces indicus TaxID=417292 RepID=A0A1G9ECZ1_9ACTN|nr:serine/threonine-protein kinase [Streptomyces indicus]SDK74039.1 Serine/threonine protein kinase [Streptomyces indicus]